jgi:hypothetical protein
MRRTFLLSMLCLLATAALTRQAVGQAVQFGQTTPIAPGTLAPPTFAPSGTVTQPFDPYAGGATLGAPRLGAPGTFPPNATPINPAPFNATPWPSTSITPAQPGAVTPWAPPVVGTPYASPAVPYGGYPQASPGVLFPQGMFAPDASAQLGPLGEPFRVLQHPRFSATWLAGGDNPRDLGIVDLEFAVTAAWPQFFGSTQPLYISPTFLLHLWDGPTDISADLPSRAYSAFLDFFWASDPARPLGVELGVAVGAFTDFNTFNRHSIRVIGEGFGVMRLTPELTFKLGVWYLNRNDLKILPAGGLVWQPNPQQRFDILFPNPKYTQYLSTVGTADVWWYVAGEYGGGAWTIQRDDGSSDRVDINDIRIKAGFDWINQARWRGYFEVGVAFDRQVIYVVNPEDSFRAPATFLMSAGFSF